MAHRRSAVNVAYAEGDLVYHAVAAGGSDELSRKTL